MQDALVQYSQRLQDDNFEVQYEVLPIIEVNDISCTRWQEILESISSIEKQQYLLSQRIDELNLDIERLTNNADGFDYAISVCSGVLCGFIDSFYVGEFNFYELKADAYKHANKFVEKYAKLRGWDGNGRLKGAVKFLEKNYSVDQDNAFRGISSTRLHHLEDLAHHPTPCGLFFAILVSFFKCAVFVDKKGKCHVKILDTDPKKLAKLWLPILLSGILRWLVYIADSKCFENEGTKLPVPIKNLLKGIAYTPGVLKILQVAMNWFGHLVSDMAGSKQTAGGGMGIPGLFLSLLKEISSLPFLKDTKLPQLVSDWYSIAKVDLRTELAIVEYAGKQSIPVIINESIIRTFYFVRHLIIEKSRARSWKDINWSNVKPWGSRTIIRMLSIASGTFAAIDITDATFCAAIKNAGQVELPTFWSDFILRVNFVGVGRFAIAMGMDMHMGHKKEILRDERIHLRNQMLFLGNAKVSYLNAISWIQLNKTIHSIKELEDLVRTTKDVANKDVSAIQDIAQRIFRGEENHFSSDFQCANEIKNILKY